MDVKLFACTGTWGFITRCSLIITDSKEDAERQFLETDFKGCGGVSVHVEEVSVIGDYRIQLVEAVEKKKEYFCIMCEKPFVPNPSDVRVHYQDGIKIYEAKCPNCGWWD